MEEVTVVPSGEGNAETAEITNKRFSVCLTDS